MSLTFTSAPRRRPAPLVAVDEKHQRIREAPRDRLDQIQVKPGGDHPVVAKDTASLGDRGTRTPARGRDTPLILTRSFPPAQARTRYVNSKATENVESHNAA
jgi:hypothetical protein